MPEAKLEVRPAQLRALATTHTATAAQLRGWAAENNSFPAKYLKTHGLANYRTYAALMRYYVSKRAAGLSFAEANAATASALNLSAKIFETNDRRGGEVVRSGGVAVR